MKLEIKHLAPYLTYGLKFNQEDYSGYVLYSLSEDGLVLLEPISESFIEFDFDEINTSEVKPILRPLSDLANEIEINGNTFCPLGNLLVQKYPKWFVENNGSAKYTHITIDFSGRFATAFLTYQATHEIQIDSTYIQNTSYLVFKKLLEWHFDVFGLIESGLAIDINTLNK